MAQIKTKALNFQLTLRGGVLALASVLTLSGCNVLEAGHSGVGNTATQGAQPVFSLSSLQSWLHNPSKQPAASPAKAQAHHANAATVVPAAPSASGSSVAAATPSYLVGNEISGSRLRSRMVHTDDGVESWVGWRDTELQEDCAFEKDAAGVLRCFPTAATRQVFFVDADCSEAVAAVSGSSAGAHYAFEIQGQQCGGGIVAHELGSQLDAIDQVFALDSKGQCTALPAPAASLFAVGPVVSAEHFVAAQDGIEDTPSRVKALLQVADDGAVRVTGYYDSALNTPCTWQGADAAICVPDAAAITTYADEVCAQPVLKESGNSCVAKPSFGVSVDSETCERTYYRPGAAFTGDSVYTLSSDAYEKKPVSARQAASLNLGEAVPSNELAKGDLWTNVTARITPVYRTTADAGVWFQSWYDSRLQTSCSFEAVSDEWRCLPQTDDTSVLYADAVCSQPITELQTKTECGQSIPPPAFVKETIQTDTGSSPQIRRVLTPRPLQATVYTKTQSRCEPRAVTPKRDYFDVSLPLPMSEFVKGELVVR